jgi:hypothetical protein
MRLSLRLYFVFLYAGLMLVWLSGCAGPKPFKGGAIRHVSATGSRSQMRQPENPKEAATQKAQGAVDEQKTFPAGAIFRETKTTVEAGKTNTVATELTVPTNAPAPVVFTSKLNDSSETRVGGAFADSASELAERVRSIRPVMFFGLAMLAAAAALAYFGWWTKAAIAAAIGVGSIALAQALPGNETKIILGGLVVFALLALLVLYVYHKGKLDRDGDGIPDFLQNRRPRPTP